MMFTIYYRKGCPFSEKALVLLKKHKITCKKYEVDEYGGKDIVFQQLKERNILSKNSKHNTVPLIFGYAGEYLGGCDNLEKFLKSHIV